MFPFMTPRNKLDVVDEMILQGVQEHKSLQEVGRDCNRSWRGIKLRMEELEKKGYLNYNPHQARGRTLTPQGSMYLKENGLLKTNI